MKHSIVLFMLTILLIGCGSTTTSSSQPSQIRQGEKPTQPAQRSLTIFVNSTSVESSDTITLATEESDEIAEYQWWSQKGDLLSEESTANWTAPDEAGVYTLTLTIMYHDNTVSHASLEMTVTPKEPVAVDPLLPSHDGTFEAIRTLISYADQGILSDVNYICVGDSTRAQSHYEGQYLYYTLRNMLENYNVSSHLLARAGHEVAQFNNEDAQPTWKNVLSLIDGTGANSIVDISLGINDYWDGTASNIKSNLRASIRKIQAQRPNTHFILTMPNRAYNNDNMTAFLRQIYIELSNELGIPLNNVVDDLMPTRSSTPYSWYRNDGFYVHLSRSGQEVIAQYILDNILP